MSGRVARDWRPLVKELEARGYTLVRGKTHYKLRDADGKVTAVLPQSPSDRRALKNAMADLRRKGVIE